MPKKPEEPIDRSSEELEDELDSFDYDAAEEESEAAMVAGSRIPSNKLLSFYDRLREKILHAVEKRSGKPGKRGRGGKLTEGAVKTLLLVPDVFILLVRLTLDKNVPASTRAIVGGALAYFILPVDLLPEAILGGAGFMDDLILATAVLSQSFGGELEPYARKHWSGPEDVRVVLRDVSEAAQSLVGENLYGRLKGLLSRRGIRVDEDEV